MGRIIKNSAIVYYIVFFSLRTYSTFSELVEIAERKGDGAGSELFSWLLFAFLNLLITFIIYGIGILVERADEQVDLQRKINYQLSLLTKDINPAQKDIYEVPGKRSYVDSQYQSSDNSSIVVCGNCGYDKPYTGRCPSCGSSLRKSIYPDSNMTYSQTTSFATQPEAEETFCPYCGFKQNKNRTVCRNCGKELRK